MFNKGILALATDCILKMNLYLDPTLKCSQVAKAICTNRTYLWEALSSRGLGFQEYLAKFRICYFLENARSFTGLSTAEIAERCGFTDAKHLSKYLKAMLGVSLFDYMRLLKKSVRPT